MMETFLANAYKCLDKNCKLFKATLIAIGNKELLQRKIYAKKTSFFYKMAFWKVYT